MEQGFKLLRRIVLVALVISVLSMSSIAQNQRRQFVADMGVFNLGQNQKMRVTVTSSSDNTSVLVRVRRCQYIEQNGGFLVTSSQISPITQIPANEAKFFDIFASDEIGAFRFRVASNSPKFVVTSQLIDTSTGEIVWADEVMVSEQDLWAVGS